MDMTEKKCAICSHVFSGDLLQCPKCGSGVFESEKTRSQLFAQESDSLSNEVINANPLLSSGPKKKCNWLKRLLNTLASKKRLYSKLMDAIESNDIDSLRRIIKKGVDVNYSKTPGRTWTPLMFASYNGNLEAVKYLIAAGANINAQADNTYDMISGEPNEIIEGRGRTALMEAVHQGNTETVDFLLENNADPNPKDRFGNTALYIAADF
jgi:ankyrin repeat protein/DNA-directed RNA polymerase subunit RPC12/RpoP